MQKYKLVVLTVRRYRVLSIIDIYTLLLLLRVFPPPMFQQHEGVFFLLSRRDGTYAEIRGTPLTVGFVFRAD